MTLTPLLLTALLAGAVQAAPVDVRPVPAAASPSALKSGWEHGAFMEIFVRGYQDSDGDGIGDLKGLTSRLDYLKDLGVKGIWLMPITSSADHDHGYATTDFRAIEPQYGTLADFDEFIKQAHARGIGVIIDYVINHSAQSHPLFIESAKAADNPWRDWYVWDDPKNQIDIKGWDIWGKNPWIPTAAGSYFATFGPHMPDFNMKNPAVIDYHESSLRFWLNRGLDGFRFDAVPHLIEKDAKEWNDQPESRTLTRQFQTLTKRYPLRHTVCEATASPTDYADPAVCGSAFAFGLQYDIIKAARGEPKAIQAVADYFKTAPLSMGTMLANHDIFAGERVWDQLKGDITAYKLAAATYLLLPGTPYIYYGEEIGMAGAKGLDGDEPLRAPMSWTANIRDFSDGPAYRPASPNAATQNTVAEKARPESILGFYKSMLKLRNSHVTLSQGNYKAALVQGEVLSFRRQLGRQQSVVLINYGERSATTTLTQLPRMAWLKPAFPATAKPQRSNNRGAVTLTLPPRSVSVFNLKR